MLVTGKYADPRHGRPQQLPYPTMSITDITALPVKDLAAQDSHLWLWTTNGFLRQGFDVMEAWGFRYLSPIVWIKPSGLGNWFVNRTQTLLFGYRGKCRFPMARYRPNIIEAPAGRHSQKPTAAYELIEAVSPGPRLELFARATRPGWQSVGNELDGQDIATALDALVPCENARAGISNRSE